MPIINPEHAYKEYIPDLPAGERFATHHIKVRPADLSRYCLIPGSHMRGRRIAEQLDDCRVVSATRGYYVYTGIYQGVRLSVCSTGMGGPVVAIAMEELAQLGVDTFLRVGSAGALQPHLGVGDLVAATGAVRLGGTANAFLPPSFPAVPNFALTLALREAATALGSDLKLGVVVSGDAFYAPADPELDRALRQAGALAIEMEADTQFILGQYRGWRCAAAFVLDGGEAKPIEDSSAAGMAIANHAVHPTFRAGEEALIRISLEALVRVARQDG
jgi:uridine phosphorylase